MKKAYIFLLSLSIATFTACNLSTQSNAKDTAQEMGNLSGRELYHANCMACHGEQGDSRGNGNISFFLFPRPRDFTKGLFKIRSTPTGEMPTDQDLFNTITRGIPGTAMPSFSYLSDEERKKLISYIKSLAVVEVEGQKVNLFEARGEPHPIKVGTQPPQTSEMIAKGKVVYERVQCAKCHGESGEGNGPSVADLKDDWGRPILPTDFTKGVFKGGSTVKDIYIRISTGMAGTPMPSFADQLTEDERWQLAYYIKSLYYLNRGAR